MTNNFRAAIAAIATLLVGFCRTACADDLQISLETTTPSVAMGHTASVRATVTRGAEPAVGVELWTYRNGVRWGAAAHTNATGHALILLPMPDAGTAEIQVAPAPAGGLSAVIGAPPGPEKWIWASTTKDAQTVYLQRAFEVHGAATHAVLLLAADDNCDAYVNGVEIVSGAPFTGTSMTDITARLKPGQNVLTVTARNGAAQAGLLARLTLQDGSGAQTVLSDANWRVYTAKPAGWPQSAPEAGAAPATVIASLGSAPWPNNPRGWPGMGATRYFPVGRAMATFPGASGAAKSNTLRIEVRRVTPTALFEDPAHQVGMAYANWFTPQNTHWDQPEAIPLLGQYSSDDTAILRQHLLWMDAMGVNFIYLDWSNTLWGKAHWSDRFPGADDLMASTGHLLDTMAAMRAEGLPTPRLTLLLGQYNGETAQPAALDEEMQAVYDAFVAPAKYHDLWEPYSGKPLMLVFETQGKAFLNNQTPLKQTHFTIRYLSTQLQKSGHQKDGFWSWMDGTVHPIPTPLPGGGAEALTVAPAFFGTGGWTYPEAVGRSAGATYIEEFKTALAVRPRFLLINQWNEFLGQAKGNGFGPNHDQYYDTYSPELSNDIEPTSLIESGYRGGVGWGFTYLNLTRALLQVYRGEAGESMVVTIAVGAPAVVTAPTGSIPVLWNAIGGKPATFAVLVDGVSAAQHLRSNSYQLPLSLLKPGRHTITVQAEGRATNFPLSLTAEDEPLSKPIPAAASLEIDYAPTGRR